MNRNVQLKDLNGNNCYPKTTINNVIGFDYSVDNITFFYGSGRPSTNKSNYENIKINDIYIDTSTTNRYTSFFRCSSFREAGGITYVDWDFYTNFILDTTDPPDTLFGWSTHFSGNYPTLKKGLLYCNTTTSEIYELIQYESDPFTWRCLTDNYTKDEIDTLIEPIQYIDDKADRIEDTIADSVINIQDSSNNKIPEIKIMGKSVQNGTPSISNPIPIVDIMNGEINITNGTDTQTAELHIILRGIISEYEGETAHNYTDKNGNKWICDTIERYKDGTGKYIQRIWSRNLNGAENWTLHSSGRLYADRFPEAQKRFISGFIVCSHLIRSGISQEGEYISNGETGIYINKNSYYNSPKTLKQFLGTNNMKVIIPLETPVETPLTAEQLAELDLSTYYPVTNISSNTDVEITYVADPKNYVNKKLQEIQNAVLSLGGNV